MSRWFRHYAGMVDDDKLATVAMETDQTLERVAFVWSKLLECAAEKNEQGVYSVSAKAIAYRLRCEVDAILNILAEFETCGLVAEGRIHKWAQRQYEHDTSAARTKAYRERKQACDVTVTSPRQDVTPPETETDTERLEIVANPIESAPRVAKRAKPKHEIAADAQPSEADLAYAASEGMTVPVVRIEWPKFRDHHISHGNRMADWPAAWRKWCGNWKGFAPHSRAGPNRKKTMGDLVRDLPLDGRHERTDVFDRSPEAPGTANPSPSGFVGKVPERDRENPGGVLLDLRPALSARG